MLLLIHVTATCAESVGGRSAGIGQTAAYVHTILNRANDRLPREPTPPPPIPSFALFRSRPSRYEINSAGSSTKRQNPIFSNVLGKCIYFSSNKKIIAIH